jgi:RNA polymerase sigma-70 factor (ECF subfamily)
MTMTVKRITYTDETLLTLLKQGDQAQRHWAFEAIYGRYAPDVWRFILSKRLTEAEAEDVFGEVWAIAWLRLPDFEWRGTSYKSWLLTTAYNKVKELFRRRQREINLAEVAAFLEAQLQLDPDEPPPPACSPPVQASADQMLLEALARLSPTARIIIELIYFKGKNSREIAETLGMKPDAVRKGHTRALQKLRHLLVEMEVV